VPCIEEQRGSAGLQRAAEFAQRRRNLARSEVDAFDDMKAQTAQLIGDGARVVGGIAQRGRSVRGIADNQRDLLTVPRWRTGRGPGRQTCQQQSKDEHRQRRARNAVAHRSAMK